MLEHGHHSRGQRGIYGDVVPKAPQHYRNLSLHAYAVQHGKHARVRNVGVGAGVRPRVCADVGVRVCTGTCVGVCAVGLAVGGVSVGFYIRVGVFICVVSAATGVLVGVSVIVSVCVGVGVSVGTAHQGYAPQHRQKARRGVRSLEHVTEACLEREWGADVEADHGQVHKNVEGTLGKTLFLLCKEDGRRRGRGKGGGGLSCVWLKNTDSHSNDRFHTSRINKFQEIVFVENAKQGNTNVFDHNRMDFTQIVQP